MCLESIDQQLIMMIRPIKSFLRVEVVVIDRMILVTNVRTRESPTHELRIAFIIDLRTMHVHTNIIYLESYYPMLLDRI